jgi:LPS-assembly protein
MHALLLTFLLIPLQQDVINTEADVQEWVGDVFTATGNVVITYRDIEVRADSVVFNEATKELEAAEGVSFIRGEERLTGKRLRINLDTLAGVLIEVEGVLGPGYIIQAGEVRRDEQGIYELLDATITTCEDPDKSGWELSVARATIEPGAQVKASSTILRVKGFPVFYLPYLSLPSEAKPRSSGFLTPQTSTSTTKGRSIRESYYHVINRSADVMVTGEYFTLRGPAGSVDLRAVPDANSKIEINSFFARDRKGQGGQSARILSSTKFGQNFRAVADMNLVSSFVFRQVFEEGFDLISSPTERSQAFATYNTAPATYNFEYSRRGTFFVDQPTTILRKLPSLDMAFHARQLGDLPVYFSLDGSFAAVHRRDAVLESPAFVERLDLHPSLEIAVLRGPAISWSHRLGFRETFYSHSERPQVQRETLNRVSFDYSFEFSGPHLERDFGDWKHVIEPQVEYRYVTGVDRFLDTLLIDDVDLFTDTNEVTYGITNRFFTDREVLSWTISQKYFSDPTFGGAFVTGRKNLLEPLLDLTGFGFADEARRFSPLVSVLRFSPRPGSTTDLQIDYDTARKEFRSAGVIGGYGKGPASFNLAYFFTRRSAIQLPSNQMRATVRYGDSVRSGLSGAFSFAYNIDQAFFQASTAQLSYNTDCYGLHVEFTQFDLGPRRESRIRFSFSLKHLGSFGTLRQQDRLF